MTDLKPCAALRSADEPRLQELDRVLERDPAAIEALRERAGLLREQGLFEAAKRDYLALIRRAPTDFTALNDFGALVLKAGYREAARSLFGQAVHQHPDNANGRVNLGNLLLLLGEPEAAQAQFEAALVLDADHVHAHRGLGNLLAERGDEAGARRHRDRGFKDRAVTVLPYRGTAPPVALLLLVAAAGGNIPTDALLDDRRFATTVLVAEYADPNAPLPPHDLVFNAIGDADLCAEALDAAATLIARSPKPVVNHPLTVRATGRLANAERLR
ncbi:MAG: tetratricopeptide repeat protein, partial [Xanthobacteraceae bacterium]